MAQQIEMLFGIWTWVGSRNTVLDGCPHPPGKGILRERGQPIVNYMDSLP